MGAGGARRARAAGRGPQLRLAGLAGRRARHGPDGWAWESRACNALLAWLDYRHATWPGTANRHVLITRKSALGTGPVSASYLADYLGRDQRGISLEHIRRDRILAEALATGADPLHLALVFNIDHTNAMAYASAARNLLSSPVPKTRVRHVTRSTHTGTPDPSQSPAGTCQGATCGVAGTPQVAVAAVHMGPSGRRAGVPRGLA